MDRMERIAKDVAKNEQFDKIDGMDVQNLVATVKSGMHLYALAHNRKLSKFDGQIDVSQSLRGMTVAELLRMIAKIGVILNNEKQGEE